MPMTPGVGSNLVTMIVGIFDIVDHIWVVDTAVYVFINWGIWMEGLLRFDTYSCSHLGGPRKVG